MFILYKHSSHLWGGTITIQATVYDTYFTYDQCVRYQALYMS